nr:atherin-like [Penaeus vannamei]
MNNLGGSGARAGPLPNAAPLEPPAKGTRGFVLGSSRFGRTYSGNPGCALAPPSTAEPPALPPNRSPGGTGKGAGSEHAGLAGWFGRLRGSASPAFRHVNPTLGPNGWQAGMAGAGARGRTGHPRQQRRKREQTLHVFRERPDAGPASLQVRRTPQGGIVGARAAAAAATRAATAAAAAPEPPARSRIKASPLVLLRNPPGPGPLLDLLSPLLVTSPPARPGPPFQEGTGRQGGREVGRKESGRKGGNQHGAVSPHSQEILVAAFPENGRGLLLSTPAAVRTVSREAMSRHSREGGSRPSKKAQGRRNVRSTRRWNHGRIAIATKTSLLAAVFPRAK